MIIRQPSSARPRRPLLDWFAQNVRAGETWLDIGAHYGYTSIALAHYAGAHGRVFAFEPMLTSVGCIAQTRRLNELTQLTVLPFALGSASGIKLQELPLVRGMVDSTLKAQNGNGQVWHETLLVVGLDDVWETLCGAHVQVHGIKLDVQGMELHVLNGMSRLLRAQRPKLVVEVHSGVSREGLVAFLRDMGYTSPAIPVEPMPGETAAKFYDDKSYAFLPDNVFQNR